MLPSRTTPILASVVILSLLAFPVLALADNTADHRKQTIALFRELVELERSGVFAPRLQDGEVHPGPGWHDPQAREWKRKVETHVALQKMDCEDQSAFGIPSAYVCDSDLELSFEPLTSGALGPGEELWLDSLFSRFWLLTICTEHPQTCESVLAGAPTALIVPAPTSIPSPVIVQIENPSEPVTLPKGTWQPPSYSEQKERAAPSIRAEESPEPEPEYPVPLRKPDGELCFGPDLYDDLTLKKIRITCEEPWIRVVPSERARSDPNFGWYCWPREHFCSNGHTGRGCLCHRRDVFAEGWIRHRYDHPGSYDHLLALRVAPENRCSPYDRDDYRYPREVESRIAERQGMLSYYTGHVFGSLKESDIEHVVALSEAHDSGLCAAHWTARRQFARDLDNLTLAQPYVNRHEKGAKDAAEWLPSRNRCWFAATVVHVKFKYDLTIDAKERDALMGVFAQCDNP